MYDSIEVCNGRRWSNVHAGRMTLSAEQDRQDVGKASEFPQRWRDVRDSLERRILA